MVKRPGVELDPAPNHLAAQRVSDDAPPRFTAMESCTRTSFRCKNTVQNARRIAHSVGQGDRMLLRHISWLFACTC